MKKRIGFGIVGLGQISGTHAAALRGQENCYLVGGFHKSREKADQWAEEYNCRPFYSLEEMLADPEIDAVSVTTPSGYHLEPALAAISAGKHVLIADRGTFFCLCAKYQDERSVPLSACG